MERNTVALFNTLFGSDKGSGAAMMFFILGIAGVAVCFVFSRIRYIRELE